METEELLRQHPIDGAVLMGGCDKTTPATIMGAISMNLPVIFLPAGPMMRGHFGGKILRLRLRRLEILGREGKPQHQLSRVERYGGRYRTFRRHLHDHGHCLDHDHHRRGRSG
jgi:dihydroxyacid dehydratase/phosphogluconate dehydratase